MRTVHLRAAERNPAPTEPVTAEQAIDPALLRILARAGAMKVATDAVIEFDEAGRWKRVEVNLDDGIFGPEPPEVVRA